RETGPSLGADTMASACRGCSLCCAAAYLELGGGHGTTDALGRRDVRDSARLRQQVCRTRSSSRRADPALIVATPTSDQSAPASAASAASANTCARDTASTTAAAQTNSPAPAAAALRILRRADAASPSRIRRCDAARERLPGRHVGRWYGEFPPR